MAKSCGLRVAILGLGCMIFQLKFYIATNLEICSELKELATHNPQPVTISKTSNSNEYEILNLIKCPPNNSS